MDVRCKAAMVTGPASGAWCTPAEPRAREDVKAVVSPARAGVTDLIAHSDLDVVYQEVWEDTFRTNVQEGTCCTWAAAPHREAGEGVAVAVDGGASP